MNGINSIYVNNLDCVRVKWGESECFKIDSGVRQSCIMSPWLLNVYTDAGMKGVKMEVGKRGLRFQEEVREWRLTGFLYAKNLILFDGLEEDLRAMLRRFVEVCRRRGLKFNATKSKVMVLGGEKMLGCGVCEHNMQLEHMLEFKYLGCVLD